MMIRNRTQFPICGDKKNGKTQCPAVERVFFLSNYFTIPT